MGPTSKDGERMDAHTNDTSMMSLQTKETATLDPVTICHATMYSATMDSATK